MNVMDSKINKNTNTAVNDDLDYEKRATRQEAEAKTAAVLTQIAGWAMPTGLETYEGRESDVVITTFPKAGTTLLQQMTYQVVVATGGATEQDPEGMAYEDINEVAPWVDFMPEMSSPPCETTPRVFKTHSTRDVFVKAGWTSQKHIVVLRDPIEYTGSWMDFIFEALQDDKITDNDVRKECFNIICYHRLLGFPVTLAGATFQTHGRMGGWCGHTKTWLDHPQPEKILILFYEDIIRDLSETARRVARFIGRSLPKDKEQTVVDRCARNFMATDPRFKCTVEGRAFHGMGGGARRARLASEDGFKKFKLIPEHLEILSHQMVQCFGVESYQQLKAKIKNNQKL